MDGLGLADMAQKQSASAEAWAPDGRTPYLLLLDQIFMRTPTQRGLSRQHVSGRYGQASFMKITVFPKLPSYLLLPCSMSILSADVQLMRMLVLLYTLEN